MSELGGEVAALQDMALSFGAKWYDADSPAGQEALRRSFVLSLVFLEQEQHRAGDVIETDEWWTALTGVLRSRDFIRHHRLLFGSVQAPGRTSMPETPLELLQSLNSDDGRYVHNLNIPVRYSPVAAA